jgi:hypothetical protein
LDCIAEAQHISRHREKKKEREKESCVKLVRMDYYVCSQASLTRKKRKMSLTAFCGKEIRAGRIYECTYTHVSRIV